MYHGWFSRRIHKVGVVGGANVCESGNSSVCAPGARLVNSAEDWSDSYFEVDMHARELEAKQSLLFVSRRLASVSFHYTV